MAMDSSNGPRMSKKPDAVERQALDEHHIDPRPVGSPDPSPSAASDAKDVDLTVAVARIDHRTCRNVGFFVTQYEEATGVRTTTASDSRTPPSRSPRSPRSVKQRRLGPKSAGRRRPTLAPTLGLAAAAMTWLVAPPAAMAQPSSSSAPASPLATPDGATKTDLPSAAPSFGECETAVTEADLRAQLADGARGSMRTALAAADYRALVEDSWRAVRFDPKFTRIVDAQIAILRQDRAYLERLLDGNIPSRAEEMAKKTADAVFNSEEFKALQTELQDEIGRRMEPLVKDADIAAQSRAAECVRTFLGQRYATTVSAAFGDEARAAELKASFSVTSAGTAAAFSLAGVITGLLTIVFRRLVRRIVAAVVRRLAGAIAARLAAWASVVLGAALLVYELVAGADGVFPVIRDELTSPQTKQTIQRALVDELSKVTPEQLDDRADAIAGQMIVRWRKFRSSHRGVLELAERAPRFRRFLQEQPPERFERLSVVVSALKATPPGGDEAVLDALDRGLLGRAMNLPDVVRLSETWTPLGVSLIDLVAWHDRTDDKIGAALAARLPLHLKPDELPQRALDRLLSLDDPRAAERLAKMGEPSRAEALELDDRQLLDLATRFDGRQLSGLFDAIRPAATPDARAQLIKTVLDKPGLISRLDRAGNAVAASDQPARALEILLSQSSAWDPNALLDHAKAVYGGEVAPMVLVYRYGWGLVLILAIPVLLAIWALRQIGQLLGLIGRVGRLGRRR